MNAATLADTATLRDELAANDQQANDPRDRPLRFSYAKAMARSAAHARHAMQFDWEPTLAMKIGSGAHSLLLGGQRLAVYPGKVRRGKEWDEFKAANADALVLSAKEMKTAQAIEASVRADPVASRVLFQPGMIYEQTISWEFNGRKFRSTPDARSHRHLVDLKTTRDASLERFRWDALKSGYHAQLWSYAKAMEAETSQAPQDVYILAVESRAPYPCSVHHLTPRALESGGRLFTGWVEALVNCETTGIWPGYATGPVELDVPMDVDVDLEWDDEGADADAE